MKRFFLILLSVCFILSLSSCGDDLIFDGGNPPAVVPEPEPEPEPDPDPSANYDEPVCTYPDNGILVKSTPYAARQDNHNYFRIPAVCATKSGTLLAFAEARNTNPDFMTAENASSFPVNPAIQSGTSKDSGDIDLVLKRSTDGGATWSSMITLFDDYTNTCGNPVPVVDFSTGRIWLFFCWNPYPTSGFQSNIVSISDSYGSRRVLHCYSDDDGLTWSKPVDATSTLKGPLTSYWYATGPCHGIQLKVTPRRGRIMIPCNYRTGANSAAGGNHSACIYSDDNGATWKLGGESGLGGNESCLVELENGDIMQHVRIAETDLPAGGGYRGSNFSSDGGVTWASSLTINTDLIDPGCQGAVCNVKKEGKPTNTLLVSNCKSSSRSNMTISKSTDGGKTWSRAYNVFSGRAAYSDIIQLTDGSVCVLYECGDGAINGTANPNERISFLRIPKSMVASVLGI